MATAENILVATFVVALVMAAAAMIPCAAEYYAAWQFRPWVFRRGLVVLSEEQVLPNPGGRFVPNDRVETANGTFLFDAPNECHFRSKLLPSQWRTASPVRGTIMWTGDRAQITGRLPVFFVVFVSAWLVGWTAQCLVILSIVVRQVAPDVRAFVPDLLLVGIALVSCLALMGVIAKYGVSYWVNRAKSLVAELEALLQVSRGATEG
jgi:hypothetical protein